MWSTGAPLSAQGELDSLYQKAQNLGDVQTVREVLQRLQTALPDAPDAERVRTRIGLLYLRLGEADSAAVAFEQVLKQNAAHPVARSGLGRVLLELRNRPEEALPHLQAAVETDSTYAEGFYFLALAHQALGKTAKARKAAGRAIKQDAGYAPPYLLLAQSYQKQENLLAAMIYYQKYLEQRPADQTAAYAFALALLEQEKYKEVEELTFRMADVRGLPLFAQTLLHKQDFEGALEIFQRYIATLDPEMQALYEDISLVGLKREARAYRSTTPQNKEAFLRSFWLRKDPFKTSGGAMRRAEHYRRVWYALTFFGETKKPWDRRGDVYIRYGEPDYRSTSGLPNPQVPLPVQRIQEMMAHQLYGEEGLQVSFAGPVFPIRTIRGTDNQDHSLDAGAGSVGIVGWRPVTTTYDWSAVPWEVWVYADVDNGIEIAFTDEFNAGNYNFAPLPAVRPGEEPPEDLLHFVKRLTRYAPAARVATAATTQPERFKFSHLEPLHFYYQTLSFRGRNGKTDLQINIGLPIDNVALPTDPDTLVIVERRVALIGGLSSGLQKVRQPIAVPISDGNRYRGQLAMDRVDLEADPGRYELAVQATRRFTDLTGVYRQPTLTLPDYNSDQLMVSDIQIAKRITEASEASDSTFVRGKWNILPWPPVAFLATEPLFVYFEIYNLTRDAFGATRYEIAYEVQTSADADGSILSTILPGIRKRTGETIQVRFEQTGTEPSVYDYVELDVAGAKPGSYTLLMNVKDLNSEQTTTRKSKFKIAAPPR